MNMVGFGEFTLFFEKMRQKNFKQLCDLLTFYQQYVFTVYLKTSFCQTLLELIFFVEARFD